MGLSLAEELAALPADVASEILAAMTAEERAVIASWPGQARPEQRPPPGDWSYWALIGGRGSGKTRGAGEWVCDRIEAGVAKWIGFIGRTAGDCRRIQVDGESGFVACAERRGMKVVAQPSKAQLVVDGEAIVMLYSADEPDSLRGPQHDTLWGDEFAAWAPKQDAVGNTAFTNAKAGLRLGEDPRGLFSTTPRPIPEVREAWENKSGLWAITRMATWANLANLPPAFVVSLREQFEGTRLAAQEFEGEFLEDVVGALWTHDMIRLTALAYDDCPGIPLRAVAVDPSVAEHGEGDECGIIAGGVGDDSHFYAVYDHSMNGSSDEWGHKAVALYHAWHAQVMVVEVNNGGALVTDVVKNIDPSVRIEPVRAADSKRARAEPIAQLWEQQRAHIVGDLGGLRAQLTGWSGQSKVSPDRLDALVWLGHWAKTLMRDSGADLVLPGASNRPSAAQLDAMVQTTASGLAVVNGSAVAREMMRRHAMAGSGSVVPM